MMSPYAPSGRGRLSIESVEDDAVLRVVFRGEADVTSLEHLESALGGIDPGGPRQVRLDVSQLDFVDVAALRRLAGFAAELRNAGREVATRGGQPLFARLVRFVGADEVLGLAPRGPDGTGSPAPADRMSSFGPEAGVRPPLRRTVDGPGAARAPSTEAARHPAQDTDGTSNGGAVAAREPGPRMTSRNSSGDGRLDIEAAADGAAVHICLRGEADVTTLEHLRSALAHIHLDGARQVELDVSELDFVDVAVLRHLTLFALGLTEAGREVRTHGAAPALAHLIRLVGVGDQLGLDGEGPDAGA